MLNKESIVKLLSENDRAVARALVILNKRQTTDEQNSSSTRHANGRGFRPCHARMGTSMASFFERNNYLTQKQIDYWRSKDKSGSMRIGIYWAQLLEEAQTRQESLKDKAIAVEVVPRDLGNDMERKMHLNYALGEMTDSDDPALILPIKAEITEIDAYWAKIQQLNSKDKK